MPDQGRSGRPGGVLAAYEPLGVRHVLGRPLTDERLAELRELARRPGQRAGRPLGVGKSTLVNALIPDGGPGRRRRQPGDRPRPAHLLLGASRCALPGGRLGHRHPGPARLRARRTSPPTTCSAAFPDLAEARRNARRACSHLAGRMRPRRVGRRARRRTARLDSLRRLLRSREGLDAAEAAELAAPRPGRAGPRRRAAPWPSPACQAARNTIPCRAMAGFDDDLRFAHVLADAADDITMRRFRALDLRVEAKPDLTPVTRRRPGRRGVAAQRAAPGQAAGRDARRGVRPDRHRARAAGSSTRSTAPRTSSAACPSGRR